MARLRRDGVLRVARIAAAALLAVTAAACSVPGPPPAGPDFRRAGAPIASKALFDLDRFLGDWQVVAAFPWSEQALCPGKSFRFGTGPSGLGLERRCAAGQTASRIALVGPGRFAVTPRAEPFPEGALWVLWVDEGYRTAVLGMPSGQGGWILDRSGAIPDDRLAAAREILDFNGYDTSRLVEVSR